MPRRASSGINAPALIGIGVVVVVLAVAAFLALRKPADSFADAPQLRMSDFLDNGNSMRGMEYRVEGKVQSRYPRDEGTGLSLEVEEDGNTEYLFIVVPRELETLNISREQQYAFKIRFEEGGIAVATAVKPL
jgi:hypothetical protein